MAIAGAVWLYGDFEEKPGLLGFLNSARKEYKGNSVRAIVSWGDSAFDYQKAYQAVAHLDLCVNVFKDGINGMYAPVETEVSISRSVHPLIMAATRCLHRYYVDSNEGEHWSWLAVSMFSLTMFKPA